MTNDIGEFRLFALAAGDYFISATLRNKTSSPTRLRGPLVQYSRFRPGSLRGRNALTQPGDSASPRKHESTKRIPSAFRVFVFSWQSALESQRAKKRST